jgi:hypothetical protein
METGESVRSQFPFNFKDGLLKFNKSFINGFAIFLREDFSIQRFCESENIKPEYISFSKDISRLAQ